VATDANDLYMQFEDTTHRIRNGVMGHGNVRALPRVVVALQAWTSPAN
jgi:hypothetical protein